MLCKVSFLLIKVNNRKRLAKIYEEKMTFSYL